MANLIEYSHVRKVSRRGHTCPPEVEELPCQSLKKITLRAQIYIPVFLFQTHVLATQTIWTAATNPTAGILNKSKF